MVPDEHCSAMQRAASAALLAVPGVGEALQQQQAAQQAQLRREAEEAAEAAQRLQQQQQVAEKQKEQQSTAGEGRVQGAEGTSPDRQRVEATRRAAGSPTRPFSAPVPRQAHGQAAGAPGNEPLQARGLQAAAALASWRPRGDEAVTHRAASWLHSGACAGPPGQLWPQPRGGVEPPAGALLGRARRLARPAGQVRRVGRRAASAGHTQQATNGCTGTDCFGHAAATFSSPSSSPSCRREGFEASGFTVRQEFDPVHAAVKRVAKPGNFSLAPDEVRPSCCAR